MQLQRKIVQEMFERKVGAGEILIKEGDTGLAATELFVVKTGKFEVRTCLNPISTEPIFLVFIAALHPQRECFQPSSA